MIKELKEFVGALVLCYSVQKGFNQVVTGLNAIHEELRKLGDKK